MSYPAGKPHVFLPLDSVLGEVFDKIADRLVKDGVEVTRGPQTWNAEDALKAGLDKADVVMLTMRSAMNADMLARATRLRGVVFPAIGTESLDIDAADKLGIIVGHGAMPENFLGMAEAAIMLILMRLYDPIASNEVARGKRKRPAPNEKAVWARMLRGRTVGLLGFGRIGRAIAERLTGWNCDIVVHDPYVQADTLPANVRLAGFDELMSQSDVVVVLVAITEQTRQIVDARALSLMKPDAHLINVSRGEAIDEPALVDALRNRRIGGASIDVTAIEPLRPDNELLTLDNCFVTPHMIGQTKDVFEAVVPTALENIHRILNGEAPLYCKNPQAHEAWKRRIEHLGTSHSPALNK